MQQIYCVVAIAAPSVASDNTVPSSTVAFDSFELTLYRNVNIEVMAAVGNAPRNIIPRRYSPPMSNSRTSAHITAGGARFFVTNLTIVARLSSSR